jgi:hypothetical protein
MPKRRNLTPNRPTSATGLPFDSIENVPAHF